MNPITQVPYRLARWARRALTGPQPAYVYDPSHTVVNDYAEYSGLSVQTIADRINVNTEINSAAWRALRGTGTWEAAAMRFYGEAETYIYDLLSMNYSEKAVLDKLDRFDLAITSSIRDHPGKDFLEFGGGLGVFCEIASGWGKRVTYLDLPGPVMDFARWRFRKYSLPVACFDSCPRYMRLWHSFDIIFTDAVFEHLIDPEQVLGELLAHLNPGGLLLLLVDLGNDPARPMHRPIDIRSLHDQIRTAGCWNLFGDGTFCSAWTKSDNVSRETGDDMITTVLTRAEVESYLQAVNLRVDDLGTDRLITCLVRGAQKTLQAGSGFTVKAVRLCLSCEDHRSLRPNPAAGAP